MLQDADVVVIGSGALGSAFAFHLAKADQRRSAFLTWPAMRAIEKIA